MGRFDIRGDADNDDTNHASGFPPHSPAGFAPFTDPAVEPLRPESPPFAVLGAAALAGAIAAAVALLVGDELGGAITAWIVAGPVGFGLLGLYGWLDARRQTAAVYTAPSWTALVYGVTVVVVLAAVVVAAVFLALWAGTHLGGAS